METIMHEQYPLIYDMLKCAGHTPEKAIEILIDAGRGDNHALRWIKLLRNSGWMYRIQQK